MRSGLKIEWTFNAQNELNAIYDYLEQNWTSREIERFSKRLENQLYLIARFPFICQVSEKNKPVRRCVLTKQTSFYYQVKKDRIIIITLYDNRRDPAQLKL
jgi:plasmid stabilization system protein ParE